MAKQTIQVDVEQSSYAVAEAFKSLIGSVKTHLADGFQAGQDIPAIISENLNGLLVAISQAGNIPAESQDDIEAFVKSWAIAGSEIAGMFLKK